MVGRSFSCNAAAAENVRVCRKEKKKDKGRRRRRCGTEERNIPPFIDRSDRNSMVGTVRLSTGFVDIGVFAVTVLRW